MAKILVLYQSSHGNTEKILREIVGTDHAEVDLVPVGGFKASRLEEYDSVALGGSIHMGKIQRKVRSFAEKNIPVLLTKRLALFIGCLDREKYMDQLETAFPEKLLAHAEVKTCLGGDVVPENLPPLMRMMMNKISPEEEQRHFLNENGRDTLKKFLVSS